MRSIAEILMAWVLVSLVVLAAVVLDPPGHPIPPALLDEALSCPNRNTPPDEEEADTMPALTEDEDHDLRRVAIHNRSELSSDVDVARRSRNRTLDAQLRRC